MGELLFFIAGTGAIAGAIGVVVLRNAFYSVLALVSHLLCLAALFLLLLAEFVAAAQVVVYAGAVMVLYVFVVAYVGGSVQDLGGAAGEPAHAARVRGLRRRAVRRARDRDPRVRAVGDRHARARSPPRRASARPSGWASCC